MDVENQVGWLIVHTEGKENITHHLKEGINSIGRISSANTPNIPVENDKYVSRNHAVLQAIKSSSGKFVYMVSDSKSLNGTYVNGNPDRISETPYELTDGDTIQIGETKLVLKTLDSAQDMQQAVSLVQKMNYRNTIEIEKENAPTLKKIVKK